jgi:hypothetical protein
MRTKLTDFTFRFKNRGAYTITYTSPKTGKTWKKYITNMGIMDKTKNADEPKLKDLELLKYIVKR